MPSVLVADAHRNQRVTLSIGLRLHGFRVLLADSSAAVLELLATDRHVDIAVVDFVLPELGGLALARRLRVEHPGVKVVLTSAFHLTSTQLRRADCGAVGFVPKPYRLDDLVDFLRAKSLSAPLSA